MVSGTMVPSVSGLLGTPLPLVEPSPPTDLIATLTTPTSITLNWNESDNLLFPVTGYKIERSTDGGNTWDTIVSNTNSASIQYLDEMLSSGTTYTYRVSAINQNATSEPSNTVSATTTNATIFGAFWTCCYGFLQINGMIHNPVPGDNQFQVQLFAPNGQMIVDNMYTIGDGAQSWGFVFSLGISRDQGKGNYVVIVTHHNEMVGKAEIPSWINHDPVFFSFSAHEGADGSVSIGGRASNVIAGEQVSIAILDPNNSITASYTIRVGIQGQLGLRIYATQAACEADTVEDDTVDPSLCARPFADEAFPTSGDYTITATLGETTATTTLAYTR